MPLRTLTAVHEEHRYARFPNHSLGIATHQRAPQSATTVRAKHDHVSLQLSCVLQNDMRYGLSMAFGKDAFHGDIGSVCDTIDLIELAPTFPAQILMESIDIVLRKIATFEIDGDYSVIDDMQCKEGSMLIGCEADG
jgi:hypothetical protein